MQKVPGCTYGCSMASVSKGYVTATDHKINARKVV